MKIIFVDGYNVINSWPNLKNEVNFQSSREKLIEALHNYSVYEGCKIKLVFDAYKVAGNIENEEEINKNISIIFTKDGETADAYIERNVHIVGRKYEVYVVTSDWMEQQTIFQRGAVRISTLEFYNQVIKTGTQIKLETSKNSLNYKNNLMDNVEEDILIKLEKIRRS